jgi:hypothetical protein
MFDPAVSVPVRVGSFSHDPLFVIIYNLPDDREVFDCLSQFLDGIGEARDSSSVYDTYAIGTVDG